MSLLDKIKEKQKQIKQNKEQQKEEKKQQKEQEKKDNIFKKEQLKKEQEKLDENNKEVIWNYEGEADITIGEIHISNIAKIILIILIAVLIGLGILGFINREKVVDYIAKPKVILTKNEVNLEVGKNFNYKEYLASQKYPKRYKIIYPKNNEVNTKKLGKYKVVYSLKNSVNTNKTILQVNVVDTTPPNLKLKEELLTLNRGIATKKFNPKKYIKSYSDNYDKKKDLKLVYPKKFDWSKNKVEVKYTIEDTSGNKSVKKLLISVNDLPKKSESTKNNNSSSSSGRPNNSSSSSGSSSSNNNSSSRGNNNRGNASSGGSRSSSKPYISGVHNITVKEGSNFSKMVSKLTSGVRGSGYVSVDYSAVNLTSKGTYSVKFSSSDGVTKYATVTVN